MRGAIRWSVPAMLVMAVATAEAAEVAQGALPPELNASITQVVEEELRETQTPGAAVAIVRDGQVVYLRAFGVRSTEERTPVTPDTLFVQFTVSWSGAHLAAEFFGQTHPLRRTRESVFQTPQGQEIVFVFKPGQEKAKYLHTDLLSAIRSGK